MINIYVNKIWVNDKYVNKNLSKWLNWNNFNNNICSSRVVMKSFVLVKNGYSWVINKIMNFWFLLFWD